MRLVSGRKIRTFNVIDAFSRQCIGIEIGFSMPSVQVTRILDQWIEIHGRPDSIRSDNGPEFISKHFTKWLHYEVNNLGANPAWSSTGEWDWWSDLTRPTATKYWIQTSCGISNIAEKSPRSGSGNTTRKGRTNLWETKPQWNMQHNRSSRLPGGSLEAWPSEM